MMVNNPYDTSLSPLEKVVTQDEGYREKPYLCTAGKMTIGFGYNISAGMPVDEALVLARYRLFKIEQYLDHKFAWFGSASTTRKIALINMAYQMGLVGLLGFRKMLDACAQGDWEKASCMALDSKWAISDTPERAKRVAAMIKGSPHDAPVAR
jgi:lysozyme